MTNTMEVRRRRASARRVGRKPIATLAMIAALTLIAAPASAQSGSATTIDALVARAIETAPALQAARARAEQAKGDLQQAGLRANPELKTERRDEWGRMNSQTAVGVMLPLELGRRAGRVAVAAESTAQAAWSVEEEVRQVSAKVRLAAVRALAAQRMVTFAEQTVASHHQWCDLLAARVAGGASAPIDRDVAEVELHQAEAAVARLRGEAAARWAELKAAVGLDALVPLTLVESLEDAVAATRRTTPVRSASDAVSERPDVRESAAGIKVAAAREDLARREGRLDLSLEATYMRTAAGFPQFGMTAEGLSVPISNRMNEFAIGATVMLPWRNRNQGAIAAAAAAKTAAEWDHEARVVQASAEVVAAQARDVEAGHALDAFATGVLELAARNLDVVRQSYQLGRVTRFEVISEENRYRDVQTAYVAALLEAYEARVMWTQALGGSR